jgi:Domain of unknown function (DUF4386)
LRGADFLSVLGQPQREAMAMLFLDLHRYGYVIGWIFGPWLFFFGLLVFRSGFVPRILGVLLIDSWPTVKIGEISPLRIPKKKWQACSRGRGADCRFAFTPLLIKLEFMERLAFLEKKNAPAFRARCATSRAGLFPFLSIICGPANFGTVVLFAVIWHSKKETVIVRTWNRMYKCSKIRLLLHVGA